VGGGGGALYVITLIGSLCNTFCIPMATGGICHCFCDKIYASPSTSRSYPSNTGKWKVKMEGCKWQRSPSSKENKDWYAFSVGF
jgi:hypothetical protein